MFEMMYPRLLDVVLNLYVLYGAEQFIMTMYARG